MICPYAQIQTGESTFVLCDSFQIRDTTRKSNAFVIPHSFHRVPRRCHGQNIAYVVWPIPLESFQWLHSPGIFWPSAITGIDGPKKYPQSTDLGTFWPMDISWWYHGYSHFIWGILTYLLVNVIYSYGKMQLFKGKSLNWNRSSIP